LLGSLDVDNHWYIRFSLSKLELQFLELDLVRFSLVHGVLFSGCFDLIFSVLLSLGLLILQVVLGGGEILLVFPCCTGSDTKYSQNNKNNHNDS